MALAKVPVLVSGINGQTEGAGPFADLMRRAKAMEGRDGVLSTSMLLVHPYLDLPDMGGGAIVITDNDVAKARSIANELAATYWERRRDFDPPFFTPAEAIRKGLAIEGGPVILLEAADCVGGGAAGDSVATLKALLNVELPGDAFVPVVDPAAAQQCHTAGEGATVTVSLGHKLVPKWGTPVTVTATVERLHDGRFTYVGGYLGGMTHSMGPSAVLRVGRVRVLVMSEPTYDWADEQFRAVGLDVRQAKFIVVKNPMNYRFGYANVMKAVLVLDTPGPTPAVLHNAGHKNVARPYYPLDRDVSGLTPRVYSRNK
jgi:microcystin degradation protein MlrC